MTDFGWIVVMLSVAMVCVTVIILAAFHYAGKSDERDGK
jgi:hypothetical protein